MAEVTLQTVINKLRVRTVREDTWNLDDVGRELGKVSEMDSGDAINFTYKIFDIIIENVNRGTHVNLGKLGTIGVSVDVQGNVKPTFRASKDLRTAVKAYQGSFKNAGNRGLDEEGFARVWIADHLDDTVRMRDDTIRSRTDYGL